MGKLLNVLPSEMNLQASGEKKPSKTKQITPWCFFFYLGISQYLNC